MIFVCVCVSVFGVVKDKGSWSVPVLIVSWTLTFQTEIVVVVVVVVVILMIQ